jgi:hypothetical protein
MASLRDLLRRTPGFAGGNLEDQLTQAAQAQQGQRPQSFRELMGENNPDPFMRNPNALLDNPNPQVLTPQNQQAITRPRTVTSPAAASMRDMITRQSESPVQRPDMNPEANPLPMRQMQPEMNPLPMRPFSMNGQNVAGEDAPFGSSGEPFSPDRPRRTQMRDFIADDEAFLRDVEQQPRNWRDKTVDAIRALNTNFNGAGQVSPPTKRERELARAQSTLGRDVTLRDKSTAAAAREANILAAEERLKQGDRRLDLSADTLKARTERWKTMGRNERRKDALAIYNSGGANDPETLSAISDALDLPADLKPKFVAGEIVAQPDATGEVQLINKRDGSKVSTGVKTYETTKEAGRDARQERSAVAAMARTKALIGAGMAKLGDPSVIESTVQDLEDQAQEADESAADLTEKGFPSQGAKAADRAVKLRQSIADLKVEAGKVRSGQAAAGTGAPKSGRTIEGAIRAFTKSQKRAPTPDEVAKMKAALGQ